MRSGQGRIDAGRPFRITQTLDPASRAPNPK